VDTSFSSRTQRVLSFLCAYLHTFSTPSWQEYLLFPRTFNSSVLPLCTLCTFSMPSWQSFSESSVILPLLLNSRRVPSSVHSLHTHAQCPPGRASQNSSELLASIFKLSTEFSFSTSCLRSMPTWQSPTELTAKFCLQLCFSYTALPPEVFNNLTGILLMSCRLQSCASTRLCLTPQSSEVHPLCTALRTSAFCHTLLV
jgi:hypothetical protein